MTAAANACNEILERDVDGLMRRTQSRPLPASRMNVGEAVFFSIVTLALGLFILYFKFNALSALLSFTSFLLYVFLYTPLKKISPISVFVGAIPRCCLCLIGWVAGTNHIEVSGMDIIHYTIFLAVPTFFGP